MRACLLALLLLFCLPLQWASAATAAPCAHAPCAPLHHSLAGAPSAASAVEHVAEAHAPHPHCSGCHVSALGLPASLPFAALDDGPRARTASRAWTEGLFGDRPERPQWTALA